jgi:hypothetical protein
MDDREIISCFAADLLNDCISSDSIFGFTDDDSADNLDDNSLNGKVVALYYSAKRFARSAEITAGLVKKYKEIKSYGHPFEIIFISGDSSEEEAVDHFSDQPWKMLQYDDEYANNGFKDLFELSDKPVLVLLDENCRLLSTDGLNVLWNTEFNHIRLFMWELETMPEEVFPCLHDKVAMPRFAPSPAQFDSLGPLILQPQARYLQVQSA